MRVRWLLCVLLGALAWAQAAQEAGVKPAGEANAPAPPAQSAPAAATPAGQNGARTTQEPGENEAEAKPILKEVGMDDVVLTIKGVCPATGATASKTAAKPAAKKPGKSLRSRPVTPALAAGRSPPATASNPVIRSRM